MNHVNQGASIEESPHQTTNSNGREHPQPTRTRRHLQQIGLACLASLVLPEASAALIAYEYAGVNDTIVIIQGGAPNGSPEPISNYPSLEHFSGTLSFDDSAAPTGSSPGSSTYPLVSFTVNLNGSTFPTSNQTVQVLNNISNGTSYDGLVLSGTVTSSNPNDPSVLEFSADLRGPDTLWNSTAIPDTITLGMFTTNLVTADLLLDPSQAPGTGFRVNGHLTQLSAVPIPAALPLFASAMGLMDFMGWRKRALSA